jgi:hypothetical protein
MSELTMCNYCSLQIIIRKAPKGSKVIMKASCGGGMDVYVVPEGEELDTRTDPKTGNNLSKQWKAWMMEIPDHCCC